MNGEKIFRFLKNIFKKIKNKTRFGKSNRFFSRVLSLIFVVSILFFKGSSTTFFNSKPCSNNEQSSDAPSADVFIKKQLAQTIDNILCVMKSYPVKLDNVGIVESDVIAFKYHLSNFIGNQLGINSDKLINDMVKGCENLYRFLADKKNHLNLKQYRSVNNLSERDISYIKKINNILIDRFKTYKENDISPYLSDESPELTAVSATLYCFASDSDIGSLSSFIEGIFTKSDADYLRKGLFIETIQNVLNVNPFATSETTIVQKQPTSKKIINKKIIRAAIVTDDKINTKEIIKYFYTVAKCKKIEMQPLSINEPATYKATKICLDDCPNMEFDIEFNVVAGSNLNKKLNSDSLHGKLIANDYYDVVIFAFDKNKYPGKHKNVLKNRINKLKNFAPRQPIVFVSDKSNQSIYEDICNTIVTNNH